MIQIDNPRIYGKAPYSVALIHGGPGAGGEMAPVARILSGCRGILEPIQTAATLEGQIVELGAILQTCAQTPAVLVGYSWGAWLAVLLAARSPGLVRKLILISSGPFVETYVPRISETRLSRLAAAERAEFTTFLAASNAPEPSKDLLARLGSLVAKTDAFDPIEIELDANDLIELRTDIYQKVWPSAAELRRNGNLLDRVRQIRCPVVAIHGDYDPHPAEGVQAPLSAVLKDFRFILLENCGHTPWRERRARAAFFEVLDAELDSNA